MRLKALALAAGAVLAAGIAVPAAATTEEYCAGTANTSGACVTPTGDMLYQDCVWVGLPHCVPVDVPGPSYRCWSSTLDTPLCSGEIRDPFPIT